MESKGSVIFDIQEGMVMLGYDKSESFGFPETMLEDKKLFSRFKEILENPAVNKSGHDVKVFVRWALERGIVPQGFVFDSKLAAYLLSADVKVYLLERLFYLEFERDMDPEPLKRPANIPMQKKRYEPMLKKF